MESLSAGQVVLVTFPFSDLTQTKLRPCLIIGIAEFDDVIVCQITSKGYGSKRAVRLAKADFIQGSIIVGSFIRPDKIATLDRSTIKMKLGTIGEGKLNEVKRLLGSVLDIS